MAENTVTVIREGNSRTVVRETTVESVAVAHVENVVVVVPNMSQTAVSQETRVQVAMPGIPGPQGDDGEDGTGGGASAYVHTQENPDTVWTITHNLGYRPAGVFVEDTAGANVEGDIDYVSADQLTVTFSAGFAGVCYLS